MQSNLFNFFFKLLEILESHIFLITHGKFWNNAVIPYTHSLTLTLTLTLALTLIPNSNP